MSDPRLAVIDLGTNTFHLLILEKNGESWSELYRERIFVNLAENGIDQIGSAPWARGIEALEHFSDMISHYACQSVRAIGTAALRRANNAGDFVSGARKILGFGVDVIDGLKEADYISRGVTLALPKTSEDLLIMDIGGGSVEFIISTQGTVKFAGSYPIGVAVLFQRFHQYEPISDHEIVALKEHLEEVLKPVRKACDSYQHLRLVGASGSFEVLDIAISGKLKTETYADYYCADFQSLFEEVVKLNLEERLGHTGIPNNRAKYVVCALFLMDYVMTMISAEVMSISNYALKEGVAQQWLQRLG